MTTPPKKDFSNKAGTLMTSIAWLVFFAFLVYFFQQQISHRNNPNQDVDTSTINGVKHVSLIRNPQGHYLSNGLINDAPVVFLLDTGATDVAIPRSVADRLQLPLGRQINVKTANGIATAYRTRIDSVSLGGITLRDVPATILSNSVGEDVLLGMAFLKHFEITQKGKILTIKQ